MKAFYLLVGTVLAFEMSFSPQISQCLLEDMSENTLMVGDFYTVGQGGSREEVWNVRVTDPAGKVMYVKEKGRTGRFSFTSLDPGPYAVCIENISDRAATIALYVRIGTQARDYTSLASTKDIKPSEVTLRRVKDTSGLIHKELQYMKQREEDLRSTNVTIHSRVIGYSLCTLLFLAVLTVFQTFYLQRLLRSKKVI